MSKVDRLRNNYSNFIAVPWREDVAAAQRVIFCVYDESDELKLRAKIDEFDLATTSARHEWHLFDLTDTFAEWMAGQRWAVEYYKEPELLETLLNKYLEHIADRFDAFLEEVGATTNSVVALQGVGSLFGFLKVKQVVEKLAHKVTGRLVVFFPGSYENNNYRLLDGYDGWDYLAVLIMAHRKV